MKTMNIVITNLDCIRQVVQFTLEQFYGLNKNKGDINKYEQFDSNSNGGGTPKVELLLSKSTQYHTESFTLQDDYKYIIANVTIPIVREGYWLVIKINNGRNALYDKAHNSSRGGRESNHRTITWENCKKGDVISIGDGGGGAANSFDIYGIK